jgi:lysylphosphatidylglycerol synthetase-like protein (DUF2156 family)
MKAVLVIISVLALLVTLAAPLLSLARQLDFESMRTLLLISAIVWLLVTPWWMGKPKENMNQDNTE